MKKLLISLIIQLITFGFIFGALIYFFNRPHKPKFHKGDCIRQNTSDEFNTSYEYRLITSVGKEEYNTLWYSYVEKKPMAFNHTVAYSFKSIDEDFEKVDCPKSIKIFQ